MVHLLEETLNRYMTQYTIPTFTIFREMGHLRHSGLNHQWFQNSCPAITSENSPVHDETPKEMETKKNNSIIDLEKLLSGEKSRSSLTEKEIYDYLKNHHVPMKGDTLFKKLVSKKSSSFFPSFKGAL